MKIPIFPGKYHHNGAFSMAMLVYRSVYHIRSTWVKLGSRRWGPLDVPPDTGIARQEQKGVAQQVVSVSNWSCDFFLRAREEIIDNLQGMEKHVLTQKKSICWQCLMSWRLQNWQNTHCFV